MKKQLLLLTLLGILSINLMAQHCAITTATTYSPNMPGITNFKLNGIDRTSEDVECVGGSCNNYVNTGLITNLERGKTYNVSITATKDEVLFPHVTNNIRIWIDYNQNDILDDAGETVLSMDYEEAGTTTSSITIPATAELGVTKMRVTIKMSDEGGHTEPSPCDLPADPLGYHGEFEDYRVNIVVPTGIQKDKIIQDAVRFFPNPADASLFIDHSIQGTVSFQIINVYGQIVKMGSLNSSTKSIDVSNLIAGQYFIVLKNNDELIQDKFYVAH